MKTFFYSLVAIAMVAATAVDVRAGGCSGPGCPQSAPPTHPQGPFAKLFGKNPLPAFQAAPWYLYWPYDGHFLTPAPVQGAFYGPPGPGNFPVNPYFPGPMMGGGYGPIPGGAPPAGPYQR